MYVGRYQGIPYQEGYNLTIGFLSPLVHRCPRQAVGVGGYLLHRRSHDRGAILLRHLER